MKSLQEKLIETHKEAELLRSRHKREMELGVADTPLYDVTTEGSDTDRNPGND